jgi:hypothetical protein
MGTVEAIVMLANLTNAALTSLQNAQIISGLIQKANSEGRTSFTPDEWKIITDADDAARGNLAAAIAKAKGIT